MIFNSFITANTNMNIILIEYSQIVSNIRIQKKGYKNVTKRLPKGYQKVPKKLPKGYQKVTKMLPKRYQNVAKRLSTFW